MYGHLVYQYNTTTFIEDRKCEVVTITDSSNQIIKSTVIDKVCGSNIKEYIKNR